MIVRRRPLAAEDIAGIWNHIADDSLRAADRWVDQLDEQFQLLATQPLMGRAMWMRSSGIGTRRLPGSAGGGPRFMPARG